MSDRPPPDSPHAWLHRARSDLALGRAGLATSGVLLEDVCFHAQQGAEKALKALFVAHSIDFPRTHSIGVLLDLLKRDGVEVPETVDESFSLTQYAVATRYPGVWEPVGGDEAHAALEITAHVLDWVTAQVGSGSDS